jgi:hypothetical protein
MALAYQKATLYGDSVTDYLWIRNIVDTNATINSTLSNTFAPAWDENTMLLAPFTANIRGGENSTIDNILNWWVYKKSEGDSVLTLVATIPASQTTLIDYNILNQTNYQYTVFAETTNYLSTPVQSKVINTSWWNWSLLGMKASDTANLYYADTSNVWLFDTNLTSGDMEQNLAVYTNDNFTQFPKVSLGKRNYLTGTIDCFINNFDTTAGKYSDSVAMSNAFKAFINNGELKLLRDRKGSGWIVQTTSNKFTHIDESAEQITKISVGYTQIDEQSSVSIIGG